MKRMRRWVKITSGRKQYLSNIQLRRFRAVPTVEMLRTTWEKTTNPYVGILL